MCNVYSHTHAWGEHARFGKETLSTFIVCMPYAVPDLVALMCYLGMMQVPYQAEVTASE